MDVRKNIVYIVKCVIKKLVLLDYDIIVDNSEIKRVTSNMIEEAVKEYPGAITVPPDESYDAINIYKIDNKKEWVVEYFVWVDDEPSELMIKILFREMNNKLNYTFWDIYVP